MTRAKIREHIFKLIFRVEFNSAEEMEQQIDTYFHDVETDNICNDETKGRANLFSEDEEEYIKDKFDNIFAKLDELDDIINSNSKGWDSSRIGKVELAILRLAVYEIKMDDAIPVGVAIDQAVELAKKYGGDDSASFINGILSGVAKVNSN